MGTGDTLAWAEEEEANNAAAVQAAKENGIEVGNIVRIPRDKATSHLRPAEGWKVNAIKPSKGKDGGATIWVKTLDDGGMEALTLTELIKSNRAGD